RSGDRASPFDPRARNQSQETRGPAVRPFRGVAPRTRARRGGANARSNSRGVVRGPTVPVRRKPASARTEGCSARIVDAPAEARRAPLPLDAPGGTTRPVVTDGEGSGRARRAGWGLAAIAGAKAWHILTGYGVAVLLPRILGSPDVFGLYSKVMAALAIL